MLNNKSDVFFVNKDYTLEGKTLEVSNGKMLDFSHGDINYRTLFGNETEITVWQNEPVFWIGYCCWR